MVTFYISLFVIFVFSFLYLLKIIIIDPFIEGMIEGLKVNYKPHYKLINGKPVLCEK
jgi:hypothetical protein